MLTWSRAHNLSKKELGLQPQSSDTKGQCLSPVYFCHLKPIAHYPPHPPAQAVTGREYHWGLLLWQLLLSSYQLSPPTFVLRAEAGPVHLPTSLFLRTDTSWDSSSNFSLAKSEPNEPCHNHIRVGFFLSFSFFVFPLAKQRLNGWALGNLTISIMCSSLFKQMVFTGVQVRRTRHREGFLSVSWTALPFSQVFCVPWGSLKCGAAHKGLRWTKPLSGKGEPVSLLCPSADVLILLAIFYLYLNTKVLMKHC